LTLGDLWREVREEDTFWSDTAERQRALVKHLLEGALEEEMVLLLEAARYRRVESRQGYRNGFY
jgi:transposase-like protein